MKTSAIRDLALTECDQVSGGISFHPEPGPTQPQPPTPPIIIESGPNKPTGGPVFSPLPNPGPFTVG